MKFITVAFITATLAFGVQPAFAAADTAKLFKTKCAMCHALDKKGIGPAVKDMSADPEVLNTVIAKGFKLMPAYNTKLSGEEIRSLVEYIKSLQDS